MKIPMKYINMFLIFVIATLFIILAFGMMKNYIMHGHIEDDEIYKNLTGLSVFVGGAIFINVVDLLVRYISRKE
jgi:hypothetical protein